MNCNAWQIFPVCAVAMETENLVDHLSVGRLLTSPNSTFLSYWRNVGEIDMYRRR